MRQKILFSTMLGMLGLLLAMTFAVALPVGPDNAITPLSSARWDTYGSKTAVALAGNVTSFNTYASTITRTWQGYFGNVTGQIVLGDSNNNTFYDWAVANPQGEIYAVRSATVPTWTSARCANSTEIDTEDTSLNTNQSADEDSVNDTFVITGSVEQQGLYGGALGHPTFYVASSEILNDTCAVAYMYNSSDLPSDYFREVLLTDDVNPDIIYTAFLSHVFSPTSDQVGFDGVTHDFQMIVGEDGHGTDTATSTYYFFIELE